ncbi:MAG: serine/threonine protein kinase, partial [Eubacterium sp.]|nr:serine/threonine protein kinase [Eubacterium sp.]
MKYCLHCVCKIEDPNGRYCPECGKEHSVYYPQSYELPPGTYLNNGRYFVGKSIGSGGYGITYIGFDIKLDKKIVIKETFYNKVFKRNCTDKTRRDPLKVEYDENSISPEKILKKSQRECSYLSKAESLSNIVKVYDWFSENNTAYIITEYIDGATLYDKICETGRYSWKELYSYMKPLIESLAQLHRNDVLHRDVKPHNIMLRKTYSGKEEFILIDFGLAKSNQAVTVGTVHVGFSPGYSPIEQQRLGEEDGTYTDVYAMAATIYHALSGEQPNGDPGLYTMGDIFPKLNSLRNYDDIPNYVVDTLEYALQIDFHHRCQTLDEFLLRLENKP